MHVPGGKKLSRSRNKLAKQKLMILVDWYSPGYKAGGPIQSCVNLANALKKFYEIYVLTSDTDHGETQPYPGIKPNQWNSELFPGIHVYYVHETTFNKADLAHLINQIDPDYIYLNHLFSPFFVVYPLWLKWRNKIKASVILCPRGALHKSALSEKSYKKLPFLLLFRLLRVNKVIRFHATNKKEKKEIEKYFPASNIFIANNLPDMDQPALRFCKKIKSEIKCLFIARIVPIKNLLYLLEVLEKTSASVFFTIAGPVEDESYWNLCSGKIKELPKNISVNYIGTVKKEELQKIIGDHHLIVLPTTGENFGHSIFEAFLVGRPVLISDQTPWRQLYEKKTGWDLQLDNPGLFRDAIETAAGWEQQAFEEFAGSSWNFAHEFITNPKLVEDYKLLFS